jgi:hypothetical protein
MTISIARNVCQVALILAIGAAGLLLSIASSAARDPGRVGVMFPPWWSPARALDAGSRAGHVMAVGVIPSILVVQSERPGLRDRLRAAGAVILLDSTGAILC